MEVTPTFHKLPLRLGNFSTLVEALEYAAEGETGYNFYSGRGGLYAVLSYKGLRDTARILARKLISLGVPRGSRVALVADTHPDFVRFFFACQYAGLVPVPLPAMVQLGGRQEYISQLERLLSICQPKLAMATDEFLPFLTKAAEKANITFFGNPQAFDNIAESDIPIESASETDLAYLQYTSGSTRAPRGVMISQKAVSKNLTAIIQHGVKIRSGDRAVSWLPFYHDMGLVGLLLVPLACQVSVDFLSTRHFAMRPRLWLKILSDNQGTISFGPPFGYDLAGRRLRDGEAADYDLSKWRVAGVGAEMIRTDTLDAFSEKLSGSGFSNNSFLPCYGMAECSLAVCFGALEEKISVDHIDVNQLAENRKAVPASPLMKEQKDQHKSFVSCGVLLPGYEAEIRDAEGHVLPERECGTLYLRGPSVMSGYFGDLKATREVLSTDGWLNTGDIAYLADSDIYITGRSKDMIIINGRNIWPQDIEYLAETQPEIRTGDAAAFFILGSHGEEFAILVVEYQEKEQNKRLELKNKISQNIRQELGIDCTVELLPRHTINRTTSGKPSRHATKRDYLQQTLADPAIKSATPR